MTGFDSKRKMARDKLDDDDDTQVYADTLLIVYQRGFADGKRAAQRKPLTDEEIKQALTSVDPETKRLPPGMKAFARAIEAAVLYECVACSSNNYPPRPEQEPCIGKDPRCPCQDGDACHYKDCGNTKARPVAQPEQEPVAWMVKLGDVTCFQHHADSKHASVPLYASPPAAQPEPTCPECKAAVLYECVACSSNNYPPAAQPDGYGYALRFAVAIWEQHYKDVAPQWKPLDDLMGVLTQIDNMTSGLVSPPAAQRPWQGLTDDDWLDIDSKKGTALNTFEQGAVWVEAKLKAKNDH